MALIDLWRVDPAVRTKRVDQILAFVGDGQLRDGNDTSREFRALLAVVPSRVLRDYATQCLAGGFADHGLALQDVINEAGRRLGFAVEPGRYRGQRHVSGHDGLWRARRHTLVVEAKTSAAHSVDLDAVAGYRLALAREGRLPLDRSSVLVVVGKDDTRALEAQIRGSPHAWHMRLISVDALLRLVAVNEGLEDPATQAKIVDLLRPHDYVRVDRIVDLVFTTAEDLAAEEPTWDPEESPAPVGRGDAPARAAPEGMREACVARIMDATGWRLVRRARALWCTPDDAVGLVCLVSRPYDADAYWFAFHPHQAQALDHVRNGYVALGCGASERLLLVPWPVVREVLPQLPQTRQDRRTYAHLHLVRRSDRYELSVPNAGSPRDWSAFVLEDAP